MKTPLLVIAFLAVLATATQARVGESVKQVEARYGKPQKVFIDRSDLRKVGYFYRGFMIIVYFEKGVSKRESIGLPPPQKLPTEKVNGILDFSARPGTSWQPVLIEKGAYYWVSSDKKTIAQFGAGKNLLLIQDRNFHSSE